MNIKGAKERVGNVTSDELAMDYVLHDLRVQAQLLLGDADWIVDSADGGSVVAGGRDVTECVLAIRESAQIACNLYSALLADGREEDAPCAIAPLAERVLSSVRPAAQARGKRCECDILGEPVASGSETLIERILYNLLSNAIRHAPEGTYVRLKTYAAGDDVCLEVADGGPGLGEREMRLLTGAEPSGKDLGLGLGIVKSFVGRMGGNIEASCGASGSAVRVFLPAARQPAYQGPRY